MKEVIIIGGGQSVSEGIDLQLWDKIQGREIWSLNYAWKLMPYLPIREIWVDSAFFEKNVDDIEGLWKKGVQLIAKKNMRYALLNHYLGEAVTQYDETRSSQGFKGVHALVETPLLFAGHKGLVGVFALSLAVAEKYDIIYLLGYDWGTPSNSDKQTHFYQGQIQVFSTGIANTEIYLHRDDTPQKEVHEFDLHKAAAENNGLKIYNVSTRSHIDAFEKIGYLKFFELIEQKVKNV